MVLTVAFAQAIARELDGFQVVPFLQEEQAFRLAGPDGAIITVRLHTEGRERGRFVIKGGYCDPQVQHGALAYKEKPPLVTVAADRLPAAIASEIKSRVLAPTLALVDRCNAHAQRIALHRSGVANTARWVAKLTGASLVRASSRSEIPQLETSPRLVLRRGKRVIFATVPEPGLVTFDSFTVTEHEAVAILNDITSPELRI